MSIKPLPIGVDNFETIIRKQYYYVDKTLLIKDLLEKKTRSALKLTDRRIAERNWSLVTFHTHAS